jgi:hypothetical protein
MTLAFRYVSPVIDCLLRSTPETVKANMASAAVVLGLTPPILALSGNTLPEMALLATRRPLLGFTLALGSPFVSLMRAFEYPNPEGSLAQTVQPARLPGTGSKWIVIVVLLAQYFVAIAAAANVFIATYQLSFQTVSSWAPDVTWTIILWWVIAVSIYSFNITAVRLRVRLSPPPHSTCKRTKPATALAKLCDILASLITLAKTELTLCIHQQDVRLSWKAETCIFIFLSWFTALWTIFHLLYGTLVFSSTLFISTRDSAMMVAGILASALCCRCVLMNEMVGLRVITKHDHVGIGMTESTTLDNHGGKVVVDDVSKIA